MLNRIIFFLIVITMISCKQKSASDLTKSPVIPKPESVTATGNSYVLSGKTVIYFSGLPEVEKIGMYLSALLSPATMITFEVKELTEAPASGIYLNLIDDHQGGKEAYTLEITEDLLTLSAHNPEGLFRGVQTIRQLLPPAIERDSPQNGPWEIPTGTIIDSPAYEYRGVMLDVARHFFTVEDVRKFIDQASLYKINFLHLHLSDDQGWRIEIKAWPQLTEIGSTTQVGGGAGGFYTQEQYKDIVNYAAERYVTIVPEIDMPGHTNAALASIPELNCDGKATELYTGTKVGFSTLCTSKEITYKFVEDVISEISAITPGPYFHIGGDESHSTRKEDYIVFVNRVQPIVAKYGKQVMGWDEISLATLIPNTVAQYWSNSENAVNSVKKGAKILMSPAKRAYLDMKYDKSTELGLNWAGYIEVDSAYAWDPASLVPGITKENIIGIEGPLWTETVSKSDEIEFLVFPRLPGLAEIGWTPASGRTWDEYKERLAQHGERMKAMGIDFYKSKLVPWKE